MTRRLTAPTAPTPPPAGAGARAAEGDVYRALFEHGVDAMLIEREDGTILRANAAACRAFGLPEAELRRQGRASRLVDDDALRAFLETRERTGSATGELHVRHADGSVLSVEASSSVVLRDGADRYAYIVFKDVTAARRAEQALRESERKLRLLADAMPQIVCVVAPDGAPLFVNGTWQAYSGLDLRATRRGGWEQVLHPDDLPAARECRRRAFKSLAPQDVELRYRAADGTYRWFLSRLAPVVEGDRVVRLVGAAMDIEDRKRAEQVLQDQLALRDQLAKVAASVPGVVCSFRLRPDGAARMEFSAPAIAELYGFASEELARDFSPVLVRMHPDDRPRVHASVAASAAELSPWHAEFRYDHPAKGLRWIEGRSIPAREADGSVLWHGYVADVTDRKLAEEALRHANQQLQEADRHKDEFLGMLSHELRSPLAPIRQSVFLLRHTEGGRWAEPLAVIDRQVEHLTRLVDDLLDVTRIARGKVHLSKVRLDLRDLVRRTADDFRARIEERGVTSRVVASDAPVWVEGDETRLAQVLSNLLHNASKFTRAGDDVTVTVEATGGEALLRVRDTGAGIEPAMLGAVFDPFIQADRTRARTEGGLGLGLALVKGLVALHGGTVRAESAGKGKGATFTVALPLAAAPAEARREPGREAARPTGHRVLVVDDNRDAADTLRQLAAILGHDAQVAYDAPSALEKVQAHLPDVVLCDLGLPGMDGYELARRIRASTREPIRLVAVSGYAQPEDVDRAMQAGFDAHVAKPADPDRIAELLA